MERLIRAGDVTDEAEAHGKSGFCEFAAAVRKGHTECGDSAFLYSDPDNFAAGVLDGVSGEPGAAFASADAARAILDAMKAAAKPSQQVIEDALTKAHLAIRIGYTTATIMHLNRDGSFAVASIGDSPAYGIDADGAVSLELPPDRIVRDNDSILKFFNYRIMVTTVIGGQMELNAHVRTGRLKKGECILLATDGLSDNLFVVTHNGYVKDSSGTGDLSRLIGRLRSPGAVVRRLMSETARRIKSGRAEEPGLMLVPKEDDIAIIAVRKS